MKKQKMEEKNKNEKETNIMDLPFEVISHIGKYIQMENGNNAINLLNTHPFFDVAIRDFTSHVWVFTDMEKIQNIKHKFMLLKKKKPLLQKLILDLTYLDGIYNTETLNNKNIIQAFTDILSYISDFHLKINLYDESIFQLWRSILSALSSHCKNIRYYMHVNFCMDSTSDELMYKMNDNMKDFPFLYIDLFSIDMYAPINISKMIDASWINRIKIIRYPFFEKSVDEEYNCPLSIPPYTQQILHITDIPEKNMDLWYYSVQNCQSLIWGYIPLYASHFFNNICCKIAENPLPYRNFIIGDECYFNSILLSQVSWELFMEMVASHQCIHFHFHTYSILYDPNIVHFILVFHKECQKRKCNYRISLIYCTNLEEYIIHIICIRIFKWCIKHNINYAEFPIFISYNDNHLFYKTPIDIIKEKMHISYENDNIPLHTLQFIEKEFYEKIKELDYIDIDNNENMLHIWHPIEFI